MFKCKQCYVKTGFLTKATKGLCRECQLSMHSEMLVNETRIPKKQSDYDLDWENKFNLNEVVKRIPVLHINLHKTSYKPRERGDFRPVGQWSVKPGDEGKSVEEAAAEKMQQNGLSVGKQDLLISIAHAALLHGHSPTSREWQVLTKEPSIVRAFDFATPIMYDQGISLSSRWEKISPRFEESDREILEKIFDLNSSTWTTRDFLNALLSKNDKGFKNAKEVIDFAKLKIESLNVAERQKNILSEALQFYIKHITKSDIEGGRFLGDLNCSLNMDKIIEIARKKTAEEVKDILLEVLKIRKQDSDDVYFKKIFNEVKASRQSSEYNRNTTKLHGTLMPTLSSSATMLEAKKDPKFVEYVHKRQADKQEKYAVFSNVEDEYKQCCEILDVFYPFQTIDLYLAMKWRFIRALNKSGHSDLFMWDKNGVYFFEVKSPNDRLSPNQIDIFYSVMEPLGLDYKIIKVSAA